MYCCTADRCGCHKKAVTALLRCAALRRIVYVSCNPDSLATNLEQLCATGGEALGHWTTL